MHERQMAAVNAIVGESDDRHSKEMLSLREVPITLSSPCLAHI